MSKSFCKTQLLGFTGADPILSTLSNGTAAASINIATSVNLFDPTLSRYVERTIWHRVLAFGLPAEDIRKNVTKGCRVYIEGTPYPETWQDRDTGRTNYRDRVVAFSIIVLQTPRRPAAGASTQSPPLQPPILPVSDAPPDVDSEWDLPL